jgi:hypothetical protein
MNMDVPLRRMDDSLRQMQENLEGGWSYRNGTAEAENFQNRDAWELFDGFRFSPTNSIINRLSRKHL